MAINAILDAIRALATSLQLSMVFPAAMLVLGNLYFILPLFSVRLEEDSSPGALLVIGLTLLVSYTLHAFNFPLIRLLEGYKLDGNPVYNWLVSLKQAQYDYFDQEIEKWNTFRMRREAYLPEGKHHQDVDLQTAYFQLARLRHQFDRDFPANRRAVLPTTLGNTIAAFEDYARDRYGMEAIALWPRLIPLLQENKFLSFVTQEKTVFDFLLNTGFAVTVLGVEGIIAAYVVFGFAEFVLAIGLTLVALLILYYGAVIAARQWGTTVRVAFDLYRYDLHQKLGLRAPETETFLDEYERWQALSEFYLHKPLRRESRPFLTQCERSAPSQKPAGKNPQEQE